MTKEKKSRFIPNLIITIILSFIVFYIGNRFGFLSAKSNNIITGMMQASDKLIPSFQANPLFFSTDKMALVFGFIGFLIIWLIWVRFFAFDGNFRVGEESGSAKWGTKKEGLAFKDLKNESNNLLFTDNFGLALSRPKFNLELDRNLNVMVIGGSGSGKTRNYVKPNLMQLNSSYFVTDPKGTLLEETGEMFKNHDYKIKSFNTINFDQSCHYNPLVYVKTDADILSFVNCLIANTSGEGSSSDPFWENSERLLYTALIAMLRDWFPKKDYSLSGLLTLLSLAEAREDDENFQSALDLMFKQIEDGKKYVEKKGSTPQKADNPSAAVQNREVVHESASSNWEWVPSQFKRNSDGVKPGECGGLNASEDFALDNYNAFKVAAGKTLKSIIISCNVRLKPLSIHEVRELITYDEMELDTLGDKFVVRDGQIIENENAERTIIYNILSDTDRTFSFLSAILIWQTIDQLCRKALNVYGGRLPIPVHFVLDEFANIGTIPDIEQTIAVTRSRNIMLSIILQSMSQLESRYDKKANTIIDCCDTTLFLGGKSNSTNKEIAEMIGKETIHQKTYGESKGQSGSSSTNLQTAGRDLIDAAEIGKMSRADAIVLIAGTQPLMDKKYPVEKHQNYQEIDPGSSHIDCLYDKKFDFVKYRESLLHK